ncbi:MAG TPA: phospholipase [Thermoanaerobaculia bacterium]|jgi:predicted esterase|nr:phospholipase [Thermoanaerobaculia bacterium]
MIARTLETSIHGRFLFEDRGTDRLLVGFHGYAESAETHMAELEKLPGIGRWSVASVQALHPFYTRSGSIVANWMTSQDRDLAIADNLAYIRRVLASLPTPETLVFIGFSQGATMAARAAAYVGPATGLILLGGDIPSEIHDDPGVVLPPALVARGLTDDWYTEEKLNKDLKFLEGRVGVRSLVFEGGHEWTDEFRSAAGEFLRAL